MSWNTVAFTYTKFCYWSWHRSNIIHTNFTLIFILPMDNTCTQLCCKTLYQWYIAWTISLLDSVYLMQNRHNFTIEFPPSTLKMYIFIIESYNILIYSTHLLYENYINGTTYLWCLQRNFLKTLKQTPLRRLVIHMLCYI